MSTPQLTDANSSGEWFRTVAAGKASDKPRTPSQAHIPADLRRKRFVWLVGSIMGGLIAFTLLGLVNFALRQRSLQSELAAPVTVSPVPVAAPAAAAPVAAMPQAASALEPGPAAANAAVKSATLTLTKRASEPSTKPAMRSPFLNKR